MKPAHTPEGAQELGELGSPELLRPYQVLGRTVLNVVCFAVAAVIFLLRSTTDGAVHSFVLMIFGWLCRRRFPNFFRIVLVPFSNVWRRGYLNGGNDYAQREHGVSGGTCSGGRTNAAAPGPLAGGRTRLAASAMPPIWISATPILAYWRRLRGVEVDSWTSTRGPCAR